MSYRVFLRFTEFQPYGKDNGRWLIESNFFLAFFNASHPRLRYRVVPSFTEFYRVFFYRVLGQQVAPNGAIPRAGLAGADDAAGVAGGRRRAVAAERRRRHGGGGGGGGGGVGAAAGDDAGRRPPFPPDPAARRRHLPAAHHPLPRRQRREFYRVLPSFTEFYRVLPSFTEFSRVFSI